MQHARIRSGNRLSRACAEALEPRRLLATITVTTTADNTADGDGVSLREALTAIDTGANHSDVTATGEPYGTNDRIHFNIPGGGVQTIFLGSSLPPVVSQTVVIDGYTQPGSTPNTLAGGDNAVLNLEIDCNGFDAITFVGSDNSVARGLAIYDANEVFQVNQSDNVVIAGNFIGLRADGTTGGANERVVGGVSLYFSSLCVVGGTSAADRNVIANTNIGIEILDNADDGIDGADANRIEGNFIGTERTGKIATGVGFKGVWIPLYGSNTIVGGTAPGARNVISSGSTVGAVGIEMGQGNSRTSVQGNYIGVDVTGTASLGSLGTGVWIWDSHDNTIGGTTPAARNVISGNGRDGVLTSFGAKDNVIQGNYIGLDATGTAALGNGWNGVHLTSLRNVVGGTAPGAGNAISANGRNGVLIEKEDLGLAVNGNTVQGNIIGLDATGAVARGNVQGGVTIRFADLNVIGGASAAARNVISGNDGSAIGVFGTVQDAAEDNRIQGNFIGTDVTGLLDRGNVLAGVRASWAPRLIIGGDTVGVGNVIAGNGGTGIDIENNSPDGRIAGNLVGLAVDGSTAMSNELGGVQLGSSTEGTVIGGTIVAARNVISANGEHGLRLHRANDVRVVGNYIGTDAAGNATRANAMDGIHLDSTEGSTIGGITGGAGNVITGNGGSGVYMESSSDNILQGNRIGVFAAGDAGPGNSKWGILLRVGSSDNQIGGAVVEAGNVIAFNALDGVLVGDDSTDSLRNSIRLNSIHSNGGLGIDLRNEFDGSAETGSPDSNDVDDADVGPNGLQNFPVVASASSSGGGTTMQGTLHSTPNKTFVIDFYANDAVDPSSFGEGRTYVGSVALVTDGSGNATFNPTFTVALTAAQFVTATATRTDTSPTGDTSEFSQAIRVTTPPPPPPPPSVFNINDVTKNEGNSGLTDFTFTVTRTSTIGAASVNYATVQGSADGVNPGTSGGDYENKSGTVNFADGEAAATITIKVKGNTTVETDQSFMVDLSAPVGGTLGDAQGLGTILNDDAAPPAAPSKPYLRINDIFKTEGHSGQKAFTFTVTLNKPASGNVTVKYRTKNGSANSSDYVSKTGSLTFSAGQTSKTITIYVKGDRTKEGHDTFKVELYEAVGATINKSIGTGTIDNDD